MSVIIRLQNLPWSANALDIRQYFHGLSIPEGGVHIVGGEQGDAFIAFSTDEDARQAFLRSNGRIKEVQITLMLSSRTEMQKVIEQARSQSYAAFMAPQPTPAQVQPLPAVVPQIVPAPVPDLREKKEESGSSSSGRDSDRKRDKKRSRSKSRERKKDRSKDRKDSRRHRDKSRSRSRDRRDRRRRDRSRSRSRNRSRSRDRDSSRRSRDKNGSKKISDKGSNNTINFQGPPKKQMPEIWANRPQPDIIPPVVPQAPSLLGNFAVALDQAPRAFDPLPVGLQNVNGFPMGSPNMTNFLGNNRNSPRDSWPPQQHNQNQNNFNNRNSDDFSGNNRDRNRGERDIRDTRPIRGGLNNRDNFNTRDGNHQQEGKNRFQKRDFNQRDAREGKGDFGDRQQDSPINTCVSMEPFYGSYGDVRRFFSGLFISFRGIKIINDHNGHRTGVCYVQFATQSQKDEALRKNHQELNGIGVEIHHIDDEEFIEAIDRYNPVMDEYNKPGDRGEFKSRNITKYFNNTGSPVPDVTDSTCLKLEDLPSYVKEQDILHIFALHPLISMHLINKPRVGHVAYAKFSSKEVARQALEERGNHIIGGKPITVSPCREEEFEEINKEHEQAIDDVKQPSPMLISDCLVVENIPQAKVNDRDISDFFSEVGAIPTKIHIMSNNLGFTGQVYCEFQTPEEAVKAAKKDNTMLGASKITVSPIAREEMASVLNQVLPGPPLQSTLQPPPVRPQLPIVQPPRNTHQQPPQQRPFFRPRGAPGDQNNGPPPRMFGFRGGPGGPRGGGGPRFGPRAPGGPRHRFQQQQQQPHNNGGDDNAMPGCTVYMDNVPYKAGTNDILDFFEGYNCSNNVSRRYNPNNTPSAEAKVMFHNADDAYRAVQDLSGRKLWDRIIHLEQS